MRIAGEFVTGILFLAIVYSLVRPGSKAAAAVKTASQAMIDIVGSATGYTPSQTGTTS